MSYAQAAHTRVCAQLADSHQGTCRHAAMMVQAVLAAGERRPEGSLAGLTLHWGCVRHEGEGWGPPPAGWHTIPDRSFGAGDTL